MKYFITFTLVLSGGSTGEWYWIGPQGTFGASPFSYYLLRGSLCVPQTLRCSRNILKEVYFDKAYTLLDHKEGWEPKNWCFRSVVLEKTPESLLNWKDIRPVNSKGNQPWIFIGRTDAKTEAPILWSSIVKSQLIGKDPDAEKDWRQKKRAAEDKMVR